MTLVKICGIKRIDHALAAAEAGADFLGLVFAPSPRRVGIDAAIEIAAAVREWSQVYLVGVFVDEHPDTINRIARMCRLDYAQLSGEEADIVDALDVPAIRTIHVRSEAEPATLAEHVACATAELVLLDTAQPGLQGGTGIPFDWRAVPPLDRPVLLAGGLNAGNVASAIEAVRPCGVDASSGVETGGVKDPKKIEEFVRAAKRA